MFRNVVALVLAGVAAASCAASGEPANPTRPTGDDATPISIADGQDQEDSALDAGMDWALSDANGSEEGSAEASIPDHGCSVQKSISTVASAAQSAGFAGTDTQYSALYGVTCQALSDCVAPCVMAGGTTASCTNASDCVPQGMDGGMTCLPPTYWSRTTGALSESGTIAAAAQLILVAIPYDDALVVTHFGIAIPDDAVILGIQFRIRKATLTGNAVDDTVQVLQNGMPVGPNRGQTSAWPKLATGTTDLGAVAASTYGGPTDTWGVPWTVADLRSMFFGVSISAKYTGPAAGNERAYIDSVRLAVFYTTTSCD